MNGCHEFVIVQPGGSYSPPSDYMSAAECAIAHAKDKKAACWGYGDNHSWYNRVLNKFFCPKSNDPGWIANAKNKHAEFIKNNKCKFDRKRSYKALLQFDKS